jgi:CO/xanthine dehydrogenase FAD-binding subunit
MTFTIATPGSVAEALGALGDGAVVLAGGTHVMPRVTTQAHEISALVSLRRAGLSGIGVEDGRATIGAATTLTRVGADERLAFLRPVIESIASPTIRNLATVGGNLFVEQPYGDLAVALLALGAEAATLGPQGESTRPIGEVLDGALEPAVLVTSVAFDVPEPHSFFYTKAMRRRLNSASIVTVAAVLEQDADGRVSSSRIALGGVGRRPVRAAAAEAALTGGALDRDRVEAAAEAALQDAAPFDDAYASAWYRRRVLPVHLRRALLGE